MADKNGAAPVRQLEVRHRGRIGQIGIYFGKFIRMFVYQSDWKVIPMAALIAGLVGFALGRNFGVSREGTLTATFAVVCVCIWNGSFNSIQVVCRERGIVKREHRSGMYILAYVLSHMMYQLILCILQTIVTLMVLDLVGMRFPGEGLMTRWMVLEIGITVLLITYASDMLSLWISTLVHSTTTAMTIMPFVLIFQLIFSGGVFQIPQVVRPVTALTISNPGLKALGSQVNLNALPVSSVNKMVDMVDNVELSGKITLGQVLDLLQDSQNPIISDIRSVKVTDKATVREIGEYLLNDDSYADLRGEVLIFDVKVGDVLSAVMQNKAFDEILNIELGEVSTVGEVIDFIASDKTVLESRNEGLEIHMKVGDAIDLVGRDAVMERIRDTATAAAFDPAHENTALNVAANWLQLLFFIILFFALSGITLLFIDKDKR